MRSRTQCGFTLLELLVVLVIAGLALGVVAPRFSALLPGVEFKSETRKMAALLRHARGLAISQGRVVSVGLNEDGSAVTLSGTDRVYHWPENIELAVTADFSSQGRKKILFYPDGSSSGGKLQLREEQRHSQVSVDWLSGRVTSDD